MIELKYGANLAESVICPYREDQYAQSTLLDLEYTVTQKEGYRNRSADERKRLRSSRVSSRRTRWTNLPMQPTRAYPIASLRRKRRPEENIRWLSGCMALASGARIMKRFCVPIAAALPGPGDDVQEFEPSYVMAAQASSPWPGGEKGW